MDSLHRLFGGALQLANRPVVLAPHLRSCVHTFMRSGCDMPCAGAGPSEGRHITCAARRMRRAWHAVNQPASFRQWANGERALCHAEFAGPCVPGCADPVTFTFFTLRNVSSAAVTSVRHTMARFNRCAPMIPWSFYDEIHPCCTACCRCGGGFADVGLRCGAPGCAASGRSPSLCSARVCAAAWRGLRSADLRRACRGLCVGISPVLRLGLPPSTVRLASGLALKQPPGRSAPQRLSAPR